MEIIIAEIASLSLSTENPTTLAVLLAAGKKLPPEATSLLMQDHAEVEAMFRQYDVEEGPDERAVLANKICSALTVHAQIEEEIFYPEAGAALEDDELITEAVEGHAEMKEQIAKVIEGSAAERSVTRQVNKLMQLVEHHVEEEEGGMFPDIQRTDIDLYELGGALAAGRVEAFMRLKRDARAPNSRA
jgi:hypothetical protein